MDAGRTVFCLVRVSATGTGTIPVTYRILAVYDTEAEGEAELSRLPETPKVRHYLDSVKYKIAAQPVKKEVRRGR